MSKTTHRQPAGDKAPSLRQRAARLRNDAGRFIKRGAAAPDADQPQPASLPDSIPASGPAEGFSSVEQPSHDAARGQPEDQSRAPADTGPVPRGEHDMGRHESFENATPIAEEMLSGTALGRMHGAGGSDPIFAMIAEAWRLTREHGRLHALCADKDDDHPSWGPEREAHDAMWGYIRGTLIETVPTTAEGCKALARCVLDLSKIEGAPLCGETESNDPVLALIAQSPLVDLPHTPVPEASVAASSVALLIEAHRTARAALTVASRENDEEFVRQAGGDSLDEAMSPAREAWKAANTAEIDAWDALLTARPADGAGLARMLRYIAESPASEFVDDPQFLLVHLAEAAEAVAADPFEGRPCPSGFVPYPTDKPMSWLNIKQALKLEGERLLGIATNELNRRSAAYADFPEDERRQHETRLRRELRIDTLMALAGRMDPSMAPLPEPGSEAAVAAFHVACGEASRLGYDAVNGYPELKRDGISSWTKTTLTHALEKGEVPPAEFARLYMLASEREHRHEAALIASNIGALHALAFPDQQRDEDEEGPAADADLIALGREFEAAAAAATALYAESKRLSGTGAGKSAVEAAEGRANAGDDVAEEIADRIAEMRATSVEGYGVKLRAAAYFQGPFGEDYPCERLLTSLIRDAGPAPVSAPHETAASATSVGQADPAKRAPDDLPADLADAIIAEWKAMPESDGTPEGDAEADRAFDRESALLDAADRLPAKGPSLLAKALALAWIEYDSRPIGKPRNQISTSERLALDIHVIVTGSLSEAVEPTHAEPDPIFAAIEASRAAEAAMRAFGSRPPGGHRMRPAESAEEHRLAAEQWRSRDAVWATVPTTRAGQLALLDYARFQLRLHGHDPEVRPGDGGDVWCEAYNAVAAALARSVGNAGPIALSDARAFAIEQAAVIDLTGLTVSELHCLHSEFEVALDHWSTAQDGPWTNQAPPNCCRVSGLGGQIVDREYERAGEIRSRIVEEIGRRTPAGRRERDQQLETLIRDELLCNGDLRDPGIRARIAETWGA